MSEEKKEVQQTAPTTEQKNTQQTTQTPKNEQGQKGGDKKPRGRAFGADKRGEKGGDKTGEKGGDKRGDRRGGQRGGDRRQQKGGPGDKRRGQKGDKKDWIPVTKLGRLVKERKITSLEQIFQYSMPIKEADIVDFLIKKEDLKDEVMKISPVQKVTQAGQRTRFKAVVAIGDGNGHCGLGIKTAAEVANAIRGALILAKLSIIPIRRGYWGSSLGKPHTIPFKVTGKAGSVVVRLVPAPRGTSIVAAPVPKKLLQFAGVDDIFTGSNGHTKTLANFVKATFAALSKTYYFLTPDLWKENEPKQLPFEEHHEFLNAPPTKGGFTKK